METTRTDEGQGIHDNQIIYSSFFDFIPNQNDTSDTGFDTLLDSQWAKHSFLGTVETFSKSNSGLKVDTLFKSTADRKYTDTTIGGSIGVGARPQFTRYSDVRSTGTLAGRVDAAVGESTGDNGMGRIYSEVYDDTAEIIFMRFGVPQFLGLSQFFTEFADTEVTRLMATGRSSSALYNAGAAVGTITVILAAPLLSLSIFSLKTIGTFFTGRRTTRFYTLKPTMHLYWSAVNMLVNTLTVNRGLVKRPYSIGGSGTPSNTATIMNSYIPDVVKSGGFVDCGAIANRAQRRSNYLNGSLGSGNIIGDMGITDGAHMDVSRHDTSVSFGGIVSSFSSVKEWYTTTYNPKNGIKFQHKPNETHSVSQTRAKKQHEDEGPSGVLGPLKQALRAEIQQGSQWAIFRVDPVKGMSDTFSNSVKTNEIADKFNAQSSTVRDIKFNFAGGNVGDNYVTNAIEGAVSSMGDVLNGVASGLTFGLSDTVAHLLAGVTMEMPKYWDAANAELSAANYTMTLISPYNNAWSHLQNIYLPMCMILAGGLPLKAGAQSHVSPFVCSIYNRGKQQKLLGMISSINITRGVSNMPFDIAGHALALTMTFSVTDLAPVMSLPVSSGNVFNGKDKKQLDEDSAIYDFLATISAMTVSEQGDGLDAAAVRWTRGVTALHGALSPNMWALQGYEALLNNPITAVPVRIARALSKLNTAVVTQRSTPDSSGSISNGT